MPHRVHCSDYVRHPKLWRLLEQVKADVNADAVLGELARVDLDELSQNWRCATSDVDARAAFQLFLDELEDRLLKTRPERAVLSQEFVDATARNLDAIWERANS